MSLSFGSLQESGRNSVTFCCPFIGGSQDFFFWVTYSPSKKKAFAWVERHSWREKRVIKRVSGPSFGHDVSLTACSLLIFYFLPTRLGAVSATWCMESSFIQPCVSVFAFLGRASSEAENCSWIIHRLGLLETWFLLGMVGQALVDFPDTGVPFLCKISSDSNLLWSWAQLQRSKMHSFLTSKGLTKKKIIGHQTQSGDLRKGEHLGHSQVF